MFKTNAIIFCAVLFAIVLWMPQVYGQSLKDYVGADKTSSEPLLSKPTSQPEPTGKKRFIFGLGDILIFKAGQSGIYEDTQNLLFNTGASLELCGILAGGFALGGTVTLQYGKFSSGTSSYGNFEWGIGPAVYYYFRMGKTILPYIGFRYNYSEYYDLNFKNSKIGESKKFFAAHSIEGLCGIVIMAGKTVGIAFSYGFVYEITSYSYSGLNLEDNGGYHKLGLGLKFFI